MRRIRQVLLAVVLALIPIGFSSSAHAQLNGRPEWVTSFYGADTIAAGMMDSLKVIDLTNYRLCTFRFNGWPPAGGSEPFFVFRIRAIGSTSSRPDSNTTGIMQLQPVADHSYLGSAAGDTLAYGAWDTGSAVAVGNGEILVKIKRPNSKWPYPHAWFFSLVNKGNEIPVRFLYLQIMGLTGGGAVGKYSIDYVLRN